MKKVLCGVFIAAMSIYACGAAIAQTYKPLAPSATTDTTNATNITSGTLGYARLGSVANGHLIANGSGGAASPSDTVATTWLDQAFCNTVGYWIVRLTGAWTCAQGIPANVLWWGAVCDNSTDDRVAITTAISALPAGATLMFPATKMCGKESKYNRIAN